MHVSIHAPARGATQYRFGGPAGPVVSIHAPARGATQQVEKEFSEPAFQSTLPRGERRGECQKGSGVPSFNPRSRAGSDHTDFMSPPPGCRFNPRSRAGSDVCHLLNFPNPHVSIHAPARGATHWAQKIAGGEEVSIHAPARGATRSFSDYSVHNKSFNPRSRAGSDINRHKGNVNKSTFQSTLPRGERLYCPSLPFVRLFLAAVPRPSRAQVRLIRLLQQSHAKNTATFRIANLPGKQPPL